MPHPLDVICAVLRHRLDGEHFDPGVIPALRRGGVDERRLVAVASRHRITSAFAACLADLGLDGHLPPDLREYFAFMRARNAARNRQLRDELGAIVARLNSVGVEPCLVKGAARLVDGLYPDGSWRFMIDLDLLVPEDRLGDCVAALCADGYSPFGLDQVDPDDHEAKHYPPLLHQERLASVELHRRLTEGPRLPLLPTHEIVANSRSVRTCVGRVRLLSVEDAIVHLIEHFQLQYFHSLLALLRLSEAVEFHLLIGRGGSDLDWQYTMARFAKPEWRRACLSFLYGTKALLGTPTPEHAAPDLRVRFQVLRTLAQQRSRSVMTIGLGLGWMYRFMRRSDKSRFLVRLAANPKYYVNLFAGQKDWA
jgi:hypothetical protein